MKLLNEYQSLSDFEADQVAGKVDNDSIYFIRDIQSIFARGKYYGLVSDDDKDKLDGIDVGANRYVLPTAGSTLGGVKTTSSVTSTSGLTACPIISGVPYYKNTDTKNTTGSTNTSSKIYLIGATSQAANPVTYSHDTAYVGTDGCLYSNSTKVSVNGHTHSYAGSSSAGGAANSTNAINYIDKKSSTYGSQACFQQVNAQGDFPHTGWFNSIKMFHNNSDGYFTEIATSFTGTDGMWRRSMVAGSQKGWYRVLDEGNYKSFMPKVLGFSASSIHGTTGTKYIDHGTFETYFGGYWLGALVDAIVAGEITGLLGDDGNYYQIMGANSSSDELHIRCDIYDAALYRGSYIDMIFTSGSSVTAYVTKY